MVRLFLSQMTCDDGGGDIGTDSGGASEIVSLLEELGSLLWQVIVANGRSESRLWLCSTIACINSIRQREQRMLFRQLLESSPQRRRIAAQVLQLLFAKRPQKAGMVLAKKCYILEEFFRGNPGHILQWFGNFSTSGKYEHQKGARAISQYAFVNRDVCWEELEWKGKHGQSPAMVATKPHYFQDLDVLRTMENFLENVPDFWSSDELAESLKDGEIFLIDTKFFTDRFTHLMYEEDAADVWALIDEFLNNEHFSNLCKHLLILLNENELCNFMLSIAKFCSSAHIKVWQTEKSREAYSPSFWLEILLLTCPNKLSMDELLLSNAVINQGRWLLRLVQSDEHIEGKDKINEVLSKLNRILDEATHWSLMKECINMNKPAAVKLLGLMSWMVHSRLFMECKTPDSWEAFFITNGIGFRKSATYSFVCPDGSLSDGGNETGDDSSVKVPGNRKKGRNRKRKKRHHADHSHNYSDELIDLASSRRWEGYSSDGHWLISTDNFASAWSSADLPEHVGSHCFSIWVNWLVTKWS